jgi:hypothetical protein
MLPVPWLEVLCVELGDADWSGAGWLCWLELAEPLLLVVWAIVQPMVSRRNSVKKANFRMQELLRVDFHLFRS